MKCYENLFVALTHHRWRWSHNRDVPMAYIVPNGTDKAAQKRKDNAKIWAGPEGETIDIVNKPLVGFKVGKNTRTASQGSGETAIDIIDPRGFISEIRTSNLIKIMKYSTVRNGEIESECIWVRDGSNNKLMSLNDPEYKELLFIKDKEPSKSEVNKKLKPGHIIANTKGEKMTYLGAHSPWIIDYSNNFSAEKDSPFIKKSGKKYYLYKSASYRYDRENDKDVEVDLYHLYSSQVGVKILDDSNPLSDSDLDKEIEKIHLTKDKRGLLYIYGGPSGGIVSLKDKPKVKMVFTPYGSSTGIGWNAFSENLVCGDDTSNIYCIDIHQLPLGAGVRNRNSALSEITPHNVVSNIQVPTDISLDCFDINVLKKKTARIEENIPIKFIVSIVFL